MATRIYVGLVPEDVNKESLEGFFGKYDGLQSVDVVEAEAVLGRGKHAFIEYETPEVAATACKEMNGFMGMKCGLVKSPKASGSSQAPRKALEKPLAHVHVVLARPLHPSNIGAVARLCNVFQTGRLCVVAPQCDPHSEDAQRASTHGRPYLDNVLIAEDLKKAREELGCVFFAGFSARTASGVGGNVLRIAINLEDLAGKLAKESPEKHVGLVFGTESDGLSNAELAECDILTTIPIESENPVLNLSHAVSVGLYEVSKQMPCTRERSKGYERASPKDLKTLKDSWEKLVDCCYEDDSAKASNSLPSANSENGIKAFQNIISRADLSPAEAKALNAVIRKALSQMK